MTTTTLVGTPDPDDRQDPSAQEAPHMTTQHNEHDAPAGEPARVIEFPTPPVVDGDVLSVAVDDQDRPVPVDPARGTGADAALPWQRREIERRPVIAPWLRRADDVRAAGKWAAGWAWHATGFHTVRAPPLRREARRPGAARRRGRARVGGPLDERRRVEHAARRGDPHR